MGRKIKEEQDELAAKTAEVMLAVEQRRDRFRQLWGVSPLRINTMRTVIPRKVAVVEEEMSSGHENAEEVDSTIEDSGRLEESYEETGVVPLPLETQARLGLTPAKAPPKNFKNAENLEFFEAA